MWQWVSWFFLHRTYSNFPMAYTNTFNYQYSHFVLQNFRRSLFIVLILCSFKINTNQEKKLQEILFPYTVSPEYLHACMWCGFYICLRIYCGTWKTVNTRNIYGVLLSSKEKVSEKSKLQTATVIHFLVLRFVWVSWGLLLLVNTHRPVRITSKCSQFSEFHSIRLCHFILKIINLH